MTRAICCSLFVLLIVMGILVAGCSTSSQKEPGQAPAETKTPGPAHTVAAERTTGPAVSALIQKTTISVTAVTTRLPAGMSVHTFPYVLNGQKGSVNIAMSDALYQEYRKKETPPYTKVSASGNSSYWLGFIDDPDQQEYIAALAQAIQAQTSSQDDQARIAVSLVQHIPYKEGTGQYRYPYEVLYQNQGVCGEKSMTLALLLRDLGFGSAVFYFLPEDHMAAGIKAASPYDFRNSGYAFIEATEPFIITDSVTDSLAARDLTLTMEVTPVGTGHTLSTVASDYTDAQRWAALRPAYSLTGAAKQEQQALSDKYDKSYRS